MMFVAIADMRLMACAPIEGEASCNHREIWFIMGR
jgi:hypothetical protein